MEFKFRAGDYRPPQHASPPSSVGWFSEPALPDPCLGRNNDIIRKPCDINEAMHRELEMMRFRERRMLAEIERQRILAAEARRELMIIEREMAIQRVAQTGRLSFYERWRMPFDTRVPVEHPLHGRQLEEQLKCYDCRWTDTFSLPHLQEMAHSNNRQIQADKNELIVLEKPDPKLFMVKRKVETPLMMAVDDIHPWDVTKSPKDEWSCALCQVTVTSERGFNQHLQGKKHKAKEAGLRAQNVSNISLAAPAPKKRRRLSVVMETTGTAGVDKQKLKVGEPLQYQETGDVSNQKRISSNYLCLNNEEDEPKMQNQCIEDPKIKHEAVIEQNLNREAIFFEKKKFKFWCKMCEVGAYVEAVMDAHVKGKKHKSRLQEHGQNYGTAAIVTAVTLSEETKKAQNAGSDTEQEKRNSTASVPPQSDK